MKKLIVETFCCWCFGMGLGLLFGFSNINGVVYYNIYGGLCVGAIFGCAFAIACWIAGCEELGENND